MSAYPSPRIGALHAEAWTALVLSPSPGEGFAFRFAARTPGGEADGEDFHWLVHELGPHAPDGSYARIAFDLDLPLGQGPDTPVLEREGRRAGLTLEWSRQGSYAVVGRVTTGYEGSLLLRPWFPWDFSGAWEAGDGAIEGRAASGEWRLAVATDRDKAALRPEPGAAPELELASGAGHPPLLFAAVLGTRTDDVVRRARALLPDVHALLDEAQGRCAVRRTRVEGAWQDLAASVTNSLHWTVLLQPESGLRYTPAGRRWIFPRRDAAAQGRVGEGHDHWTIFGWDSWFNALQLAVESPALAWETLLAGLATQYPNGCVPNWRGRFGGTPDRSQPPLAALAAVKLWLRSPRGAMEAPTAGNHLVLGGGPAPPPQALHAAYPHLLRWAAWWTAPRGGHPRRDGNANGLCSWGSDLPLLSPEPPPWERDVPHHQLAAWESGQDDLPTWDEIAFDDASQTLQADVVDLNAYRALDLECLARAALALGRADEADALRRRRDELRTRMNDLLWDEDRGMYVDRLWSGAAVSRTVAAHFLPLAAGIPDRERAKRMLDVLLDERRFWGERVIPTVSRDDPSFGEQQYWRGSIWPPMNYLIVMGLRRYGFDAAAAELAARGAALFLDSWRRFQTCRENFDSRTGQGFGQSHQSWAPLFSLAALEEFADVTPWDGLRVGSLRPPPGGAAVRRFSVAGHHLDVTLGAKETILDVDGVPALIADGPVVLRSLRLESGLLSARAKCEVAVTLAATLEGNAFSVTVGSHQEDAAEPRVRLDAGEHRVEVRAFRP